MTSMGITVNSMRRAVTSVGAAVTGMKVPETSLGVTFSVTSVGAGEAVVTGEAVVIDEDFTNRFRGSSAHCRGSSDWYGVAVSD